MLFQRIDINVLDRFLPLGETILPTSSLGCSHPHPVRGPIAGAGKPRRVDETFHQPRTIMVAPCEVFYQPLQAQAQQPRGQIAARHAGPNQKTAQAHHPMQVRASLFGIPTDPTVPLYQLQRGSGKTERAQPAVCGADQITDRSEEHTSELQSRGHLVCRPLLEKKNKCRLTYYT